MEADITALVVERRQILQPLLWHGGKYYNSCCGTEADITTLVVARRQILHPLLWHGGKYYNPCGTEADITALGGQTRTAFQ